MYVTKPVNFTCLFVVSVDLSAVFVLRCLIYLIYEGGGDNLEYCSNFFASRMFLQLFYHSDYYRLFLSLWIQGDLHGSNVLNSLHGASYRAKCGGGVNPIC